MPSAYAYAHATGLRSCHWPTPTLMPLAYAYAHATGLRLLSCHWPTPLEELPPLVETAARNRRESQVVGFYES